MIVQTKSCTKCKSEKPLSDFQKDKRLKSGFESWCKKCKWKGSLQSALKKPEALKKIRRRAEKKYKSRPEIKAAERGRQLRYHYGISADDVSRMMKEQDGKCKICLSTPSDTLVVDHCHETLIVRGLLCRKCNAAIGFMNDDIRLVRRAIAYLEETQNAR